MTDRLLRAVEEAQSQLANLRVQLQCAQGKPISKQSEIARDLLVLQEEFPSVTVDLAACELAVTTEPIELEDLPLGPFEIRLDWQELSGTLPYKVVALEPNPARSNDSVTHPHVSDGTLCEGNGRLAIRSALKEGRLVDFFAIVRQLLETYAKGHAYVEIGDWHGRPCGDCGYHISDDYGLSCTRCEDTVCDECLLTCGGCQEGFCGQCIGNCRACGAACCPLA